MPTDSRKGVFFDLGGTLVSAYPSVAEHISQSLAEFGYPTPHRKVTAALAAVPLVFDSPENLGWSLTRERSFAFWNGYYARVLAHLHLPQSRHTAIARHIYDKLSQPQGYALYPDVLPTLERLRCEGYVLGLISNWEAWGLELIDYHGIGQYFPTQVLSGCAGVEKPDTAIYTLALAEAGIAPAQTLFVGDSPQFDVAPSLAVGMEAVLIDRHIERHCSTAQRIRSLRELHDHPFLQP